MRFLKIFRVHLQQIISWKLLVYGLVYAIIQTMAASGVFADDPSVWYMLVIGSANGVYYFTLYILPTLAFAMTLSLEFESKAVHYWVIRSGVRIYTISKVLACAIAGFLTVCIGLSIFIGCMSLMYPMFITETGGAIVYEMWMENGKLFLGIGAFVIHYSLSGAYIAVLGMVASIYIKSPYSAVAMPLAISLVVSRLLASKQLQGIWAINAWVESIHVAETPEKVLYQKGVLIIGIIALLCFLAVTQMKRRLHNE